MSNRPLAFTAERLLHILQSFPVARHYIVAFSGGADSTALLHALCSIRECLNIPVSAVHVNHNLHKDAGLWRLRCEKFCRQHQVKLVALEIHPKNRSGKGLEADARHLRYEAMTALLKTGTCLLTAHHADDQAETLLLNLMRGSGVDGLSAMPRSRPLGEGLLQRPLLGFKGSALRDYLRDQSISWTEDPSNEHLDHDRNFVRHEVIPLLEQRWPEVSKRFLLTHNAMTEARHLLEKLADDYLVQSLVHPLVLQITAKPGEDPELLKLVIRRWLKRIGIASIPVYRLETFCDQVHTASSDHHVAVRWGGWSLRLYQQQLWLHRDVELSPCPMIDWPCGHDAIDLGGDAGQLLFTGKSETGDRSGKRSGLDGTGRPAGEFSVANRSDTSISVIRQGAHHKSLKNLFQQADIPPWLRDCIPLCKLDNELVAFGDWCFEGEFASWMTENGMQLSWRPRNALLQFIRARQHTFNP